jgi:catechol 2,3-dioxygenase-like lactoylglutathione lyase family enzyme
MASHGLLHIALLTRDLKKTEQFYKDVLGLRVTFRIPPNMVFLRSPGSKDLLNFVRTRKRIRPPTEALQHFGFKATNAGLRQLEKRLKENHVDIDGRRGKHAIYFRDPNGYTIEYYCD